MNDKIKTISTKNLDAMIADNYVKLAIFNKLDFPEPEDPIIATFNPFSIFKDKLINTSILFTP